MVTRRQGCQIEPDLDLIKPSCSALKPGLPDWGGAKLAQSGNPARRSKSDDRVTSPYRSVIGCARSRVDSPRPAFTTGVRETPASGRM